jgi:type VI secretion system secreted protein VgrG
MTQEIKMSDDAGKEELYLHASKDLSIKVGGTSTTVVDGDQEHSVGLGLTSNVLGGHTATVGGQQAVDVGKELVVVVDGGNTEIIGAAEIINVTANRAVVADGSYVEVIGAAYGIQCNQSNTKTDGVFTRAVGGNMLLACGLSASEAVAAVRTYVCRGSRQINASGSYGEGIKGGKRAKAGAVRERASGNLGVSATLGNLSCGSATLSAGAKFTITAAKVTIDVTGSIKAGPLELGGGKLQAKSGTTEISGLTTRARGGEVGS